MLDEKNQITGLHNMMHKKPVKVIAVTGGKGGVGKTNVSINLAQSLIKKNQKVMLLDADLGLANVNVLLGLKVKKDISLLLEGKSNLDDIVLETESGLKIIPSSSGLHRMAELTSNEHYSLIRAFSDLTTDVDTLIVDTAAGISKHVLNFTQAATDILVVVCNEPTSITDSYALIKVLNQECGMTRFHIVANMVKNYSEGRELFLKLYNAAERFLDVTLLFDGVIPHDDMLRRAIQKQTPVVTAYPNSASAIAFKQLSDKISQWPMPKADGHVSFFIERIINNESMLQEEFS